MAEDEGKSIAGNCRMYEEKYPNVDDLVVVQVKQVTEMGAYVSLLEYDNIEGLKLPSHLVSRWAPRSLLLQA